MLDHIGFELRVQDAVYDRIPDLNGSANHTNFRDPRDKVGQNGRWQGDGRQRYRLESGEQQVAGDDRIPDGDALAGLEGRENLRGRDRLRSAFRFGAIRAEVPDEQRGLPRDSPFHRAGRRGDGRQRQECHDGIAKQPAESVHCAAGTMDRHATDG